MEVEYVDIGDAVLWTGRSGSGPPIVWCHGGPGLWDYLGPVAELCDAATSYRYDQRACGRSTGNPPHTIARFVDDLETLRRHFGHERWIVGGHSWGAMLGLFYALKYPDYTAGLVYLSGVGINPAWREDFERRRIEHLGPELIAELQRLRSQAAASGTIKAERELCEAQWSCDFVDRLRGRELARQMFVDGVRVNNEVGGMIWADAQRICTTEDLSSQAGELNVPALLIHGSLDMRPFWPAQELAALLPNGRFALLEEAAHFPWAEQPELLRGHLNTFVEQVY